MIEELQLLLGDRASQYTEQLLGLVLKQAIAEVEAYCNRTLDYELEVIAMRIALIKLNRIDSEGLTAQSYSGVSETYVDGYPADILAVLNRKRKIKFL